jgi:hypothetical protein
VSSTPSTCRCESPASACVNVDVMPEPGRIGAGGGVAETTVGVSSGR